MGHLREFRRNKKGSWKSEPGKFSELILEFAEPLFHEAGEPESMEHMKAAMRIATMCWNLPVFEKSRPDEYAAMKSSLDSYLEQMPPEASETIKQMIKERTTTYSAVPVYINVEVTGDTLENAQVVAEARDPNGPRLS